MPLAYLCKSVPTLHYIIALVLAFTRTLLFQAPTELEAPDEDSNGTAPHCPRDPTPEQDIIAKIKREVNRL